MRAITQNAVAAFNNCTNFNQSNTQVKVEAFENGVPCLIRMYLHGNLIAEKHINKRTEKLYITNAGWESNTTKERLNGLNGVSIHQKDFQWYLNGQLWDGKMTKIE